MSHKPLFYHCVISKVQGRALVLAWRLWVILLVAVSALSVAGAAYSAAESGEKYGLAIRGSAYPGGALLVSFSCEEIRSGSWEWAGRQGLLLPAPYGWRVGLAVPLDAVVGARATLKFGLNTPQGAVFFSRKIKIEQKKLAHQYLSLQSESLDAEREARAQEESQSLAQALLEPLPGVLWKGNFSLPSTGPRALPFGVRRMRYGHTVDFHTGLDFADWEGTPVAAPAKGKVTFIGLDFVKEGNCLILSHGLGLTSYYSHLSGVDVKVGQTVNPGQRLGLVGSTGVSAGPHLHYACFLNGVPIDPDVLLNLPHEWAPESWEVGY